MERILDARMRHIVERKVRENQLGFRKGRGTDDGLFAIRQIIEKRRAFRKDVAFVFVDLEQEDNSGGENRMRNIRTIWSGSRT